MKSHLLPLHLYLPALMLLIGNPACADIWLDLEIGAGTDDDFGISSKFNYADQSKMTSFGLLGNFRGDLEVSLTRGQRIVHNYYTVTYSSGVAYMNLKLDDCAAGYNCGRTTTIGIPLHAGITFGRYAGLKLNFYANVNSVRPFAGLNIGFSLGQF